MFWESLSKAKNKKPRHLLSRTFYRSENPNRVDARTGASTHESTVRPQANERKPVIDFVYDTQDDTSMDSQSPNPSRFSSFDLDFNVVIKFFKENTYGAKIYQDFMNRYLVKVEDHLSTFDLEPFVNYQGECYMG